ncbi:hypothetical protein QQF64_010765 [Cirrhinus molitorella]|uniref:Uncharacterized protein n=2 Tax=Cirrhinus molitorella TaxID=172907 RepID=A0ABR3LZR4_9TELE|nr:hypothetical protein Q8A67_019884 [Cirrhinus molitorella]
MLRSIVLIILLISSVCALHLEMRRVKSTGNELEDSGKIKAGKLHGVCWACRQVMEKLRSKVTSGTTKNKIKIILGAACNGTILLKYLCKMLVEKYMDTLIKELSTSDNAKTICVNIGICKGR